MSENDNERLGTSDKLTRSNKLREIMEVEGIRIQDLTTRWRIGGATVNGVRNFNQYPSQETRTLLVEAINQVLLDRGSMQRYAETDIWPLE